MSAEVERNGQERDQDDRKQASDNDASELARE
jgi:hypothetical protein